MAAFLPACLPSLLPAFFPSFLQSAQERVLWELMGKREKNFDGSVMKEEARVLKNQTMELWRRMGDYY